MQIIISYKRKILHTSMDARYLTLLSYLRNKFPECDYKSDLWIWIYIIFCLVIDIRIQIVTQIKQKQFCLAFIES
jgi:hypothetical protein